MLEFAVDGESLGAHQTTIAKEFMEALRLNGKETRAAAIVAQFNLLNEHPLLTSECTHIGFDRSNQNG